MGRTRQDYQAAALTLVVNCHSSLVSERNSVNFSNSVAFPQQQLKPDQFAAAISASAASIAASALVPSGTSLAKIEKVSSRPLAAFI